MNIDTLTAAKRKRVPHAKEVKQKAEKYYLLGLSLCEIEKLLNVPLRTLEKWQTVDKWTETRNPHKPHNKKRKAHDLRKKGFTVPQIAKKFEVVSSTVYKWLKHVESENEKMIFEDD